MFNYYWLCKIVIKKIPVFIILLTILNIISSFIQPLELLITQNIAQCILYSFNINNLIILILLYLGILTFQNLKIIIFDTLGEIGKLKIETGLYSLLFHSLSKTPLVNFDKFTYLNKIKRARYAIENISYNIINNILSIFTGIIGITGISIIIFKIHFSYIILFIIFSILHNIYVIKITKENIKLSKSQDKKNYRHTYFVKMFYDRFATKELKTYKLYDWLETKRLEQYSQIKCEHIKYARKWTIVNIFWSILMYFCESFIWFLMIYQISQKELTIDQVIIIIQGLEMFMLSTSSLINLISTTFQQSAYISDLRDIIDDCFDNRNRIFSNRNHYFSLENKTNFDIILKNICFSYTTDKLILSKINLSINKGETIALVGYNGSGKSTLAKILAGLLLADTGYIFTKTENITAVFQDFAEFQLSLKENIYIGNVNEPINDMLLLDCLRQTQCIDLVDKLPYGLDTFLGKEFAEDGSDISLGEWQKIAISRSIYRNADFIIFDEPSASLDPIAEKKQFDYIQNFLSGKTVVIISHRIGLTKLADRIAYMEKGKIIEIGTHNELMMLHKEYYNFYLAQAKWYSE